MLRSGSGRAILDDMRRRAPFRTGNDEAGAFMAEVKARSEAQALELRKAQAVKAAEEFEKYIKENGKVQTFRGFDRTPIFTYRAALKGRILEGWIEDRATYLTEEDAERHGWERVKGEERNLRAARSRTFRGI